MRKQIAQRLWVVKGTRSIRQFAEDMGVDRETLRRALSGDLYQVEIIVRVCEIEEINANWLLFGIGPQKGRDLVSLVMSAVEEHEFGEEASRVILDSVQSGHRRGSRADARLRLAGGRQPRGSRRGSTRGRVRS